MAKFITVNAAIHSQNHGTATVHVNIDSIAVIMPSGNSPASDQGAAILTTGGFSSPAERIVCSQTVAQVKALIDAALA